MNQHTIVAAAGAASQECAAMAGASPERSRWGGGDQQRAGDRAGSRVASGDMRLRATGGAGDAAPLSPQAAASPLGLARGRSRADTIDSTSTSGDVCLTCCEPLSVAMVGECDHPQLCFTCALRMRHLYKGEPPAPAHLPAAAPLQTPYCQRDW